MKDLARGVGNHILGLVRTRVSPELADLMASFAHQITTTIEQDLSARISNATDSDVVDIFIQFAGEVLAIANGKQLILSLDDGDKLDESDRRRLADLAEQLPDGVVIRVAFAMWNGDTRASVTTLRTAGLRAHELQGLSAPAIEQWLETEGLDVSDTAAVLHASNGYALHVSSAIDLIRTSPGTSPLADLQPSDVTAAQTEAAWRELDVHTQAVGAALSAFEEPLSSAEATQYLNLTSNEWHTLERQLVDSLLFTGRPPWFHELRRRHLWKAILTDDERMEYLEKAVNYLQPQLLQPRPEPGALVQYAGFVSQQHDVLAGDPRLAAAASATGDELAILASLIELTEANQPAHLAESLLLYARQFFGAKGDLVEALKTLEASGLVAVASNEHQTAVVAVWPTVEITYMIAGRAGAELGRLPIPQLSTSLFVGALRPGVEPFREASYGIGTPRISELSTRAARMQRMRDGVIHVGRKGPNLLLRLKFGRLPLYAAIAYDADADRDAAAKRCTGWSQRIGDQELVVADCLSHPMECIPVLRFLRAAELLRGKSLITASNPASHAPIVHEDISLDTAVERAAQTLEIVRDRCAADEVLAYGLEQPIGYLYRGTVDNWDRIEVIGRAGAERLEVSPSEVVGGGFYRVEIARLANLLENERPGMITLHSGATQRDPMCEELIALVKRGVAFNNDQDRVQIPLDQATLESNIARAASRRADDALALRAVAGMVESDEVLEQRGLFGSTTYVLLYLDTPDKRYVPAAQAQITRAMIGNRSGAHRAQVIVRSLSDVEKTGSWADIGSRIAADFGLNDDDVHSFGLGRARTILSELLGYRDTDVAFQYPT
jgi:hypothetical protein